MKLHLGCYHRKIHGFVNVDIRQDVDPDLVDDAFKLTKITNNSVDLIYTCHMLEHASRTDAYKAMYRWWEVLKPEGILRVSVPDLEALFKYYLETGDMAAIENLLYGSQKHEFDFHYTGWTESTLTKDLKTVGFKSVKRYDWRNTEHFYIDDYSQSYLPKISYSTRRPGGVIGGTLVSLNMEATK